MSTGCITIVDSMPDPPPLTNGLQAAQMGLSCFFSPDIVCVAACRLLLRLLW